MSVKKKQRALVCTTLEPHRFDMSIQKFTAAVKLLREIDPDASLYVAGDTLHLMAGPSHDRQGCPLRANILASTTRLKISGGDW